jgi:chorismate mutase-like protein
MAERRIGMSIENWRTQIDDIDQKLVKLMNERTKCVIEIAKIKKQHKLNVVDPDRERDVFRNVEKENHGPLDVDSLNRIFGRIIEECRRIERHITGENAMDDDG